jgi:Major Facilitator Superfamily
LPEQTLEKDRLDPRVWRIVLVAVLGSFLAQLDATVVNVSLSSLSAELHTSLAVIQWVTSGYLLALALMLPLNAWLVERIGAKRLYLLRFSGFTLASALCALSWSAGSLIGFRVPRFPAMASKSGMRLGLAVAAYRGNCDVDLKRFEDAADMLCDTATLHGLAHLVLEEKAAHFFRKATSRQFVKKELPKVLARLYPDRNVAISREKTTLANS